ncbi:solute carrier family 22 member 8 isoform 3 [Anopheles sinensis]|uniref:Solute carrier family 22 member 8 isoform 3 n=1 Tax=Anopheles sinensis TaxID=74873 RepID=A0A084W6P9_ANOSI|nr:solute carrier family 22 member 8 isoform 3 [Anopheles sinensis]
MNQPASPQWASDILSYFLPTPHPPRQTFPPPAHRFGPGDILSDAVKLMQPESHRLIRNTVTVIGIAIARFAPFSPHVKRRETYRRRSSRWQWSTKSLNSGFGRVE